MKIKIGATLISKKDYLQSSPILKGELLSVVENDLNDSIYVIRTNGEDSTRWALTPADIGDTYDFYTEPTVINNVTIVQNPQIDTPARIDTHYDFFYDLTMEETNLRQLKIDPYFVSNQWGVGARDPSGVLFHILKTIARFGDKNAEEREIQAIYLQIKRLAELKGVELE